MRRFSASKFSASHIKEKVEPHLHWEVPREHGMYKENPRWSNPDLDPLPQEKRTWRGLDYWAYWCSDMLAPPLASTVSSVMALGFTARETIPIVFFGFAICSVVITLTGKMGATYAIPFPVIVRSVFGMYGSLPAICIRAFVALMWTAILTVQAGAFLQRCLEAIWPSFINFPNHLPESAGITSAGLLCFFLYWFVQTSLALMPIQKLRILFWVKGVIVPPTFLALFIWAAVVTGGGGKLVTGRTELTSSYMNTAYSALTGLNAIIGLFSSMAVNMPDFGRFSRNRLGGYHQFFALPVIGTLGSLMPIFVTSAHEHLWGEFEWYLPATIARFESRAAKFFTAFVMIIATIGNQVAAGTYPFSNDITGLWPKYINIFRACLFICVFCVISTPWNIIRNAAGLLAFLSGYSCLMGPLAGTMVCDYYIIKKRKLNLHEMYRDRGIYWYSGGFNWRAYVSFVIGFAPLLPGFAKSIDNDLNVGGGWKIYTFAWIFGFSISFLVHYVINTYVSPATEALVDVAVYPEQLYNGESPPSPASEEVSNTTKEEYVTKEREISVV
ncbi:permease for cytosine/purines, uracil, thiamine, allantoin-domain-containing protein [Lineolata rhizophorae]|uniref:Permease for cytosine/purines, uracil, thiamine, allantoin-domain-containing protein n=1 Tax=Lineolata rhizophorae TaxID=578093 RepID=A0A6A6NPI1_9PEZI|nr:permease for cytosine/purines, uracil, thiamine, allantoin-domain-containing protein [Lineolata rhizophorae]